MGARSNRLRSHGRRARVLARARWTGHFFDVCSPSDVGSMQFLAIVGVVGAQPNHGRGLSFTALPLVDDRLVGCADFGGQLLLTEAEPLSRRMS